MVLYLGRGGLTTARHIVADETVALPARAKLDFQGAGVTVIDNVGTDSSVVTIPGGSGGGGSSILDPRLGVPQGTVLRTYTFDSGVESWAASASGGTVAYDSTAKAMLFVPNASNQSYIMDPGGNVGDGEFVVDLSATFTGTVDIGLAFRYVDDNNNYTLMLRSHQYTQTTAQLYKRVAGTYTAISDTDTVSGHDVQFSAGARVRCLVRFVGSQISWYLNEAHLGTITDSTYTTGRLAVRGTPGVTQTIVIYGAQAFSLPSTWEPYLYGSGGAGTATPGVTIVNDEGVAVTARNVLNFVGTGVSVTDDGVGGKTQVTIPGAGPAATGAIEGVGITKITVSSTQPSSPTTGDVWIQRS